MWSAIIASTATIATVLYMQGPIVALALTALSSVALLIVLRAGEGKNMREKLTPRPSEAVDSSGEGDLAFSPLRKEAS